MASITAAVAAITNDQDIPMEEEEEIKHTSTSGSGSDCSNSSSGESNSSSEDDKENDARENDVKRKKIQPKPSIITIPLLDSIRKKYIKSIDKPADFMEEELLDMMMKKIHIKSVEKQLVKKIVKSFTFSYIFICFCFICKKYYVTSSQRIETILKSFISKFMEYRNTSEYIELIQKIYNIRNKLSSDEISYLTKMFILALPNHNKRETILNDLYSIVKKYSVSSIEQESFEEDLIFQNLMQSITNMQINSQSDETIYQKYNQIINMSNSNYNLNNEAILDLLNLMFLPLKINQSINEIKKQKLKKRNDEISNVKIKAYVFDCVEEVNKLHSIIFDHLTHTYVSNQKKIEKALLLCNGLNDNILYYKYIMKLKEHLQTILKERNNLSISSNGFNVNYNIGYLFYSVFKDFISSIENEIEFILKNQNLMNDTQLELTFKLLRDNLSCAAHCMLSWVDEMLKLNIPNKFIFVILSYFNAIFGTIPCTLILPVEPIYAISPLEKIETFKMYIHNIFKNKEQLENILESQLFNISIFNYHQIINNENESYIFGYSLIYKNTIAPYENSINDNLINDISPITPIHRPQYVYPSPAGHVLDIDPMTPQMPSNDIE